MIAEPYVMQALLGLSAAIVGGALLWWVGVKLARSLEWRLSRMRLSWHPAMRSIDRQIAEARKRHRPVNHLLAAKRALVNASLSGR